ncbi:hypothetical protein WJX77_003502 [Trebouxia sp. C0004]
MAAASDTSGCIGRLVGIGTSVSESVLPSVFPGVTMASIFSIKLPIWMGKPSRTPIGASVQLRRWRLWESQHS